jgi:Trk-type K+ transport system membrane component
MTPEERSLLERTYNLTEDNNKILRSMRRSQRVSTVIRSIYWLFIIGASLGAYYLVQPYIDTVFGAYKNAISTFQGVGQDIDKVQNAADSLKDVFK